MMDVVDRPSDRDLLDLRGAVTREEGDKEQQQVTWFVGPSQIRVTLSVSKGRRNRWSID
jgi:hypothetical protein